MIDQVRGNPVLKDVATLIQTIQQKLPTTVSVEVLQKILDTKDGYKYLANIDGTLTEMIAKQDLQNGVTYWADGVKNQSTNMLILDNLVQKPQLLQNEIFKNETLSNILGFNKLVEVLADELGQGTPQTTQNTQSTPTQQSAANPEPAPNMNSKEVIRLSAADSDLAKTQQQTPTAPSAQTTQSAPQSTPATQEPKQESAKSDNVKSESPQPQKTAEPAQKNEVIAAKQSIADAKENVAKELKEIVKQVKDGAQTTEQPKAQSEKLQTNEIPKQAKSEQVAQNPKLAEQPKTNDTKELQISESPKQKEAAKKEELKEKLASFKNLAESPTPPSKAELEKAKMNAKEEIKSAVPQTDAKTQTSESVKVEISEKIAVSLAQNFDMLPKNMLDDAVKKLTDMIFGKFTPKETDETINKILEHLQKQAEQKAQKDGDKHAVKGSDAKSESIEESKPENAKNSGADSANTEDRAQKSESSPASKIKAQILEELAKTGGKTEFGILSNVAMALNKEVFTFVLPEKGVLQFRKKKNGQKERGLNAKTVEFYSAFETLGPVSGEITHIEGEGTNLSLNVEFESTYRFLKDTMDQLSFFDKKNVSITHGIKEIVEIKSSFLDTIG